MTPLPPSLLALIILATTLPPRALAWGQLPHRTIALISTRFLLPETASFIRTILPKDETISAAAIWGDYFSHTPEGRWSGQLHYIDAHDDPENGVCGVDFARDCGEGGMCVVGGIVNVTSQLQPPDLTPLHPPSSPPTNPHRPPRRRPHHLSDHLSTTPDYTPYSGTPPNWATPAHLSLRFLLHLIADIHQPLHTENLSHGGNGLHVRFSGHDSNLHSTWDSLIPQSLRHGRTPRHAQLWADELFHSITSLPPATLHRWAGSCFLDIERLVAENGGKIPQDKAQECAMEWASYTNSYICSYVFKDGVDSMNGRELSGEYTENARDLVDELVGMAGWRLGGWLNLVATGKLGLDLGEAAEVVVEVEDPGYVDEEGVDVGPVVNVVVGGDDEHGWKGRMRGVVQKVGGAAQMVFGRVREVNWV